MRQGGFLDFLDVGAGGRGELRCVVEKGNFATDFGENSRVLFSVITIPLKSNVGFKEKMKIY